MKFNKIGQVFLVSAIALILATTFTACNPVTIDYLFVAGYKQSPGQIQTFQVDRVSGALSVVGSTVSSGGVKPVSEAVSTDFKHLYVANQGDSTLVEFSISAGGQLSSVKSVSLSSEGNTPVAIAMNAAGTLLYVANLYQPGCSSMSPCAGALAVFPISADGTISAAVANGGLSYFPVGVNPTALTALADGSAVYVTSFDPTAGLGHVYGFTATSAGALSQLAGSPYAAGVKPSGIASDPTSRFVYATDFSQNQLIAYSIIDKGVLRPLINGPFRTGSQPTAIQVDPRGRFIYLSNSLDNTVSAYAIEIATGTPSAAVNATGSAYNITGTQPVAILIDPGFGRYVYTANLLDNSLSGFQLNPSTGTLAPAQNGPFPSIGEPSALAMVPHGNHSIQINQP